MFEIQNYISFIAAIVVFQLIPGPGTIAILNATARNGVRAGGYAVFGTLCGDAIFMISAVVGLAAFMKANPSIFLTLQWLGSAYLLWIGANLLWKRQSISEPKVEPKQAPGVYFRQAFAVSITNPKVILFFVSFFPLFLRPEASSWTLVILMLHVTLISFFYQGMLVLVGNRASEMLRTVPDAKQWTNRLAGIALIGFGFKLLLDNKLIAR